MLKREFFVSTFSVKLGGGGGGGGFRGRSKEREKEREELKSGKIRKQ